MLTLRIIENNEDRSRTVQLSLLTEGGSATSSHHDICMYWAYWTTAEENDISTVHHPVEKEPQRGVYTQHLKRNVHEVELEV